MRKKAQEKFEENKLKINYEFGKNKMKIKNKANIIDADKRLKEKGFNNDYNKKKQMDLEQKKIQGQLIRM